MGSSPLREKLRFFEQFDSDSDSDSPDEEELALRRKSRAFFAPSPRNRVQPPSTTAAATEGGPRSSPERLQGPRRTASEPTPAPSSSSPDSTGVIAGTPRQVMKARREASTRASAALAASGSFVEETPVVAAGSRSAAANEPRLLLRRSATNPLPFKQPASSSSAAPASPSPSAVASAAGGSRKPKRKRNSGSDELKIVPEADRIFRGLSFFYIPNDDVNPARRIRITKARELGASWVREVGQATHVVVDKRLTFKDIESIVAPVIAPQSTVPPDSTPVIVVNEEYPIDCLKFRRVLNPMQWQYRVVGLPQPQTAGLCPAASTGISYPLVSDAPLASSEESLQIKTRTQKDPSKWNYVPPTETPPRDGRLEEERGSAQPHAVASPASIMPGDVIIPSSQPTPTEQAPRQPKLPEPDGGNEQRGPSNGPVDELSSYMGVVARYKDLPLDDDEDDTASSRGFAELAGSPSGSEEDRSGSEEERAHKKTRSAKSAARPGRKNIDWNDRFACHQGGTKDDPGGAATNPNARTIEILQSMLDYYTRVDDNWRIMAYRKAIKTLQRQTRRITTEEEAIALPTIGPRLAKKIEEIAATDRLCRLEYAQGDAHDDILQTFIKVYGVGNAQACKWIAQGFRTLDDLRDKAKLTANQRLGVEHYDDLNTRIPRREVEALGRHVRAVAAKIDPDVELIIGGSYRRRAETSGDIDLIITRRGTTRTGELVPFLDELVARLFARGFLVATVASHGKHGGAGNAKSSSGSKWHGCCVLPRDGDNDSASTSSQAVWRRIDLLLVPETEMGAALIYFTGNDIFNRSIRLLASKKGMRLNQRGLYRDVMRGPGRAKITEGQLLEGRDERRIFELLGVKWREPSERWC